ncbi:MAG: hypothetical protein H0T92_12185 [Pyrinomonadaceae bacterium]|nr:hypothetical protein [Pyrinomonadaceae bacterium]
MANPNICITKLPAVRTVSTSHVASNGCVHRARIREGEGGYILVALLALMTVLMLAMIAAAPSIQQQHQRELEREAIARGEEVAEAIRLYVEARGALPTSIEQLLEGAPIGIKKKQILRATAARDPLSRSGEWRLVRPNDAAFLEFKRAVILYAGGQPPQGRQLPALLRPFAAPVVNIVNLGTTASTAQPTSSDEGSSFNNTGPFIGVASRSRRESVINYYGIDHHDAWVFTPIFR